MLSSKVADAEEKSLEWSGYLRIRGNTPIARTDKIVEVLEGLSDSLSILGAEVKLLLFIEDPTQKVLGGDSK